MKKILSALLVFTLLLSTLCILPVAATEVSYDLVIDSADDWTNFETYYEDYADKAIKLECNVTASKTLAAFSGTFDGNGNTITISAPLFESLAGATVKNVILAGNVTADSGATLAALSLGATDTVTIERCVNNASVSLTASEDFNVGAFVAFQDKDLAALTIKACVNNGAIQATSGTTYRGTVSGFVGRCNSGDITIDKCVNNGAITSTVPANSDMRLGGFFGRNGTASLTISNCVNKGDITSVAGLLGGVIGDVSASVTIFNCYNYGEVKNTDGSVDTSVGGIAGRLHKSSSVIACINKGAVTLNLSSTNPTTFGAGGIAGAVSGSSVTAEISDCYSLGTVTATNANQFVNGIIGYNKGTTTVTNTLMDAGVTTFSQNTGTKTLTFVNTKYVAAEGENTIKSVDAWNDTLPIKGIGYQTTAVSEGVYNVRFVSTITEEECANYDSFGYEIIRYTATSAGAITTQPQTTVYSSINGAYTDGENMGETTPYYALFVVEDVPANEDVTFVVRPFVKSGDTVVYGNALEVKPAPTPAT